ncbi:Glutathione S-transferase theta-1 [Mactra antiquata]
MVVQFYYDLLSQPCRAVYMFLQGTGIEYEKKPIELVKGEQRSEEFVKINPYHKVPAIVDGDMCLSESAAIMRYLAVKFNVAESWYPRTDLVKQARCDEFLHWQHLFLRRFCVEIFLPTIRSKMALNAFLPKVPLDEAKVQENKELTKKAVNNLAEYFIGDKPYILGDEISVADLVGVVELTQLDMIDEQDCYAFNEKVKAWVERVQKRMGADYDICWEKMKSLRGKYLEACK